MIQIQKAGPPAQLERRAESEFHARFTQSFADPAFAAESDAPLRLEDIAWDADKEGRESSSSARWARSADSNDDFAANWIDVRTKIDAARPDEFRRQQSHVSSWSMARRPVTEPAQGKYPRLGE